MEKVSILGTGMAGFGAAYALECQGVPAVCYDKTPYYGGHTFTIARDGFHFDEGGHISFTKDDRIRHLLAANVQGDYQEPRLQIDNYWHGHRITHPVQCNLNALPTELTVRILTDFIAASARPPQASGNYEDWLRSTYGDTFAETFPMVYGRKYHTIDARQLTTDWLGPRMYRPDLEEILHGALAGQKKSVHYVDVFRYPSRGGFMAYLEPFAERYDLRLSHELTGLDPLARVLRFRNGQVAGYDALISSMPLPELVPLIDGVPADVLDAARDLAFTTAVLLTLGVDRADLWDSHITYFYDEDVVFPRINFPHMFSAQNAPPGKGLVQAEVYFSDKYRPLQRAPESYLKPMQEDLRRCGVLREDDTILFQDARIIRYANVIYDHDRSRALSIVHGFLDDIGLHYCGRYGDWNHAWTDEAFKSGEAAAQRALDDA